MLLQSSEHKCFSIKCIFLQPTSILPFSFSLYAYFKKMIWSWKNTWLSTKHFDFELWPKTSLRVFSAMTFITLVMQMWRARAKVIHLELCFRIIFLHLLGPFVFSEVNENFKCEDLGLYKFTLDCSRSTSMEAAEGLGQEAKNKTNKQKNH